MAIRPKPTPSPEIVRQFQDRHDIAGVEMVVAADAGMLSAGNLKDLDDAVLKFIVGSRVAKAPADLANHFHWNGDVFVDDQVIDTVTPRHAKSTVNDVKKRTEPVWDPVGHPKSWRAVWHYRSKRAVRDNQTLNAQETRAREVVDGGKVPKSTRFVKTTAKGRSLDTASIERARSLVGLKGYVTNIPATLMDPEEVIGKYHDLWHVEQSLKHVENRPESQADLPPHPGRDRSAPDHRVRCFGGVLPGPAPQRPGDRQRRQTAPASPFGDHRDQRHPAHLPARDRPRHPRPHRQDHRARTHALTK